MLFRCCLEALPAKPLESTPEDCIEQFYAQLQIILQSMGTPLLKVSEATSNLLEQNAIRLATAAVSEQRGRDEGIHLVSLSLKSMLRSISPSLQVIVLVSHCVPEPTEAA